MKTVSLCLG